MDNSEIIKEASIREIREKCYDVKVDGITIYNFVRRPLFERYIRQFGSRIKYRSPNTSKYRKRLLGIYSLFQILILFIKREKFKYFIYPFYRLDRINDEYLDKFTDPIIDYTCIGENCIIFESGNNGLHLKPRRHNDKIVYADGVRMLSNQITYLRHKSFYKKHSKEFNTLFKIIEKTFPGINYDKEFIIKRVYNRYIENKIYKYIFRKLETKAFIAPSRNDFQHIIPAAKQSGMQVFELQHGFVKNLSITYSGYKDPMFTPDYFLAYGDLSVNNNYGIDIERIKVIGWAFDHYLSQEDTKIEKKKETDILMIADPLETDKLIDVCIILARNYPSINFYYRAHPGEILDERLKLKLTNENNIHLDDNSQNILVTLKGYTHVIGVNSTVLNEALTFGKKVGILYLEGFCPFNIDGSEDDYYWKIDSIESFRHYINASPSEKKQRKIYSKFDKTLFEQLMNV